MPEARDYTHTIWHGVDGLPLRRRGRHSRGSEEAAIAHAKGLGTLPGQGVCAVEFMKWPA